VKRPGRAPFNNGEAGIENLEERSMKEGGVVKKKAEWGGSGKTKCSIEGSAVAPSRSIGKRKSSLLRRCAEARGLVRKRKKERGMKASGRNCKRSFVTP